MMNVYEVTFEWANPTHWSEEGKRISAGYYLSKKVADKKLKELSKMKKMYKYIRVRLIEVDTTEI